MEENTLKNLLRKINIDTYYYDEYDELVTRSFEEVIGDLSDLWEALNDDYKGKLYEAMGIMPSKYDDPYISYPSGLRTMPLGGNINIEYVQNQPTSCEAE